MVQYRCHGVITTTRAQEVPLTRTAGKTAMGNTFWRCAIILAREKAEDLWKQYEDIEEKSGSLIDEQFDIIDTIKQAIEAMPQEPPPKKQSDQGESKLIQVLMEQSLFDRILEFEKTYPDKRQDIRSKQITLRQTVGVRQSTVQKQFATSSSPGSTVQLYCGRKGVFSEGIIGILSSIIQTNPKIINDLNEVKSDLPLIAICINSARLESDVDQGLHNVNDHINMAKVACLVIHVKEEHALPTTASREILAARARELGVMLDAAYTYDLGFYNCAMNDNALRNLFAFIQAK